MAIDHKLRAALAWPILANQANSKGKVFTYGELCSLLGFHYRAASHFLGVIQDYCHSNNLPALQALVVSKKTKLPGYGYNGSPITRTAHNNELSKVYAKTWPTNPPVF